MPKENHPFEFSIWYSTLLKANEGIQIYLSVSKFTVMVDLAKVDELCVEEGIGWLRKQDLNL
jgi:hypothetical protein